ncbi:MAG: hypothetical protein HRT70_06170 [Flavobacteriaceae bacterium]|nr:hypothetical protein [Flavobacteriaceae bacterium]
MQKKIRAYARNIGFLIKNRGFLFYLDQRVFQFIRLITTTSALPSIFLGALAIMLSFYSIFEDVFESYRYYYFFVSVFFIIVTTVIFSRAFFKRQTPKQYADFSIQGREHSKSIRYISYSIWKVLIYYQKQYRKLYDSLTTLSDSGVVKNKLRRTDIEILRQDISKYSILLSQICDMMGVLSKSMSIPSFRISDFLFQFSPDIFNHEMSLCLKRLDEIIAYQSMTNTSKDLEVRATQIIRSFDTFYRRIEYQKSLFKNKDLHSNIIDISMGMGLTSSLTAYSLGLQKIGVKNNKDDKNVLDRLKFLYHKRRMFPGFDIHCLLTNLISKDITIDKDYREKATVALRLLSNHSEYFHMINELGDIDCKNDLKDNTELFKHIVPYTNDLVLPINRYIHKQRREITKNFQDFILTELKKCEKERKQGKIKKLVFITRGYSSVVNNTLYNSFVKGDTSRKEHNSRIDEIKNELYYTYKRKKKNIDLYIYVLKSQNHSDTKNLTSTRYVRYQFKENPNMWKNMDKSINLNIKVGDEDWVKNRFDKKDECKCYLLSGAEFFQVEKTTWNSKDIIQSRMINTEGINDLAELGFNKTILTHLVLAENYKHFPRPLTDQSIRKALNRENLEYLHIYKWNPLRIVISDKIYANDNLDKGEIEELNKENKMI